MSVVGHRTTLQEYVTSEWQDKGENLGLDSVVMAIADGSRRVVLHVVDSRIALGFLFQALLSDLGDRVDECFRALVDYAEYRASLS